jgi:hypothetical protein
MREKNFFWIFLFCILQKNKPFFMLNLYDLSELRRGEYRQFGQERVIVDGTDREYADR